MKGGKILFTVVLAGALAAGTALAASKSSTAYGEQLFNDPELGGSVNDNSCSSCHANGDGLAEADENAKLTKTINKCVTRALETKKIDGRSAEMRSLKMYVLSLAEE